MVTKGHHHMNHAKILNYFMQAIAVIGILLAVAAYGKVPWETTKNLMGLSAFFAFSAFFHALFHYIKEDRMKR